MKTDKEVKWLDDILYSLIASQAYRGALLRFPRICRRRGRSAPHHTAATYVRTHVYIGSGYPYTDNVKKTRSTSIVSLCPKIFLFKFPNIFRQLMVSYNVSQYDLSWDFVKIFLLYLEI